MAKGMSMEEFRQALSSDATVENEKLKEEIKSLKKLNNESSDKIKELEEELEEYKKYCNALGNRCFVHTQGILCLHCDVPCPHSISDTDVMDALEYMRKNNIPMTKDKAMKETIENFLARRREQKQNKVNDNAEWKTCKQK